MMGRWIVGFILMFAGLALVGSAIWYGAWHSPAWSVPFATRLGMGCVVFLAGASLQRDL